MRKKTITAVAAALLLLLAADAKAQEEITAKEIIERAEELMRSDRAYSELTMEIITPDWRRSLSLRSWDDRVGKRSFIHILSPPRDKDTTFLRLDYELWMYLPRAERTIKIPPSMMHQSWMGSDFTNDDLVKESSYITDYEHELQGMEEVEGRRCYILVLLPKENAPVTWGKIECAVSVDPFVPVRYRFFNRRMELRKEMVMSEVREMGGRSIPVTWSMQTVDKPGHKTVIRLEKIEFEAEFPERTFTQQHLRSPR